MTNLALQLKRLGLLEYLDILIAEGFDTWDTVLDITEPDLNSLNVKINDQKRLQRAITKSRRWDQTERPTNARTKRKYTRRPKPDKHAPERPLTAYVAFSKHIRDILEGQEISFTEIAKIIGARWQCLSVDAREAYQCQANVAKEQYSVDLAEYKKSSKYHAYKVYLKGFKKNHSKLYLSVK
ncbi:high mobility group box domain-containing protein [Dendryphion nanum]|uniref:High mobility group box domain-containing protein n=1 Tax=Dendryphion nanum TaxID=256645 RepID=A0A9P9D2Q2_9PLEO|nr:high mobility group box domain-containing protein [Dendryphion nanum]